MIRYRFAHTSSLITPSCLNSVGLAAMLSGRDYGLPDPLLVWPDGGSGERPTNLVGLSELAGPDGVLRRGGLSLAGFMGQQLIQRVQRIQRIRWRRSGRYTCATVPRED